MVSEIKQETMTRMDKTINAFKDSLSQHRTGRANPEVLSKVTVNYYGSAVPISQVANISAEDALTLVIKPWEKHLGPEIERAIHASDLGLNPSANSDVIRVPFPPLTEERRKEFIKKVKAEAESARISLRSIRREINTKIKALQKSNEISEDDAHGLEEQVQKVTNDYVAKVEQILSAKEKDLLEM